MIKDDVLDRKHNRPGECMRLVPEPPEDVIGVLNALVVFPSRGHKRTLNSSPFNC
jgi:hypothetical protein